MNRDDEDHDHNSARNTRSDALFFHRRLVSRPSVTRMSYNDPTPADTSAGSTFQSSPSANSFANSTEEAKPSPLATTRPFMDKVFTPRARRRHHPDSTDDPSGIQTDVAAVVTGKAIRDSPYFSQSNGSAVDTNKWILCPEGRFLSAWDIFILVLLVYVVFVSVYVYSFLGILSPTSPWFWIERFLDVSFLIDIVLTFFTAYHKKTGGLEKDPKRIRRRYILSWFFWDVLATFPWDVIALGVYGTDSEGPSILLLPRFLRLLRLARLFRLVRLLRMNQRFTDLEVRLRIKYGYLRLATLFFTVTLIAHWFACLFYYFGAITASVCQLGQDCEHRNWFEKGAGDIPTENFGRYVAALYFSVYTITTIGYGDVVPENTAERLYVIVIMFMGAAMFAYVISQVSNIQNDLNVSSVEHRKKMDQLTDFARYRKLDPKLQERIRERFQREFRRQQVSDEKALLEGITGDLRKEVLEHIYEDRMKGSRLIQAIPKQKRGQVYMHLKEYPIQTGHSLYSKGDKPNGFFIIQEGMVELRRADGEVLSMGTGAIFGEEGVVFERAREETAVCTEDTDLIEVPREAVKKVLEETEEGWKKLEREETLMLWQKTIAVVEAQIRYANVARGLREKAEADFKARGIAVVSRPERVERERGMESGLVNSISVLSSGGVGRRGFTGGKEAEEEGEMEGVGGMERMRMELEEKRTQVRTLQEKLERLQSQLNDIASGIGAAGSREI